MSWNDLSMSQKAEVMKLAVESGVYDLDSIREGYNEYASGGKIHIAPSKRGTFTAAASKHGMGVQQFASRVLAHKENYSPAMVKKANFARNAAKWKHEDGGLLALANTALERDKHIYDGTTEKSQKLQLGREYWQSNPELPPFLNIDFPVNGGQLQEVVVTGKDRRKEKLARLQEIAEKRAKDYLTISNDNTWVENRNPTVKASKSKNPHLTERSVKGAKSHALWEKEHPVLNTWGNVLGAVPFAVASAPLVATAGSGMAALGDAVAATSAGQAITAGLAPLATAASTSIAGAPLYTWANVGLSSLFGAHGIQTAINEGGISPTTALEIAPLGRLASPIYNAVKPTANFVPTIESNMAGIRYAYNRNPELANVGTLEDYNEYLKTVFPESKVRDINYHMGPKGMQELKPSTGEIYNTNPNARGIYVTPDKSYTQKIRKFTADRLEKPSAWTYLKRNLTPGGWDKANETFTDIYPVMIDTKNPLYTKGTWTWGIKDNKYQSLMDKHDAIVNSGPKWYQNFNSMPETIVPKTEQTLILGSDADVVGFRKFMSSPQINSKNAASMTPEQWTAAQDAAIAKGDMAEAQRLRDLHFMIKAPNTFASINGKPLQLYHGTNNDFNAFDLSKYGSTDGGTFGRGVYTTPIQEYAQLYGKNNMPLYMKLDNPRDYRDYSIGDLMAEKLAFGEDFSTGNGIDGVIGRPSWKGFKGLEEYVSHNPKNIKSSKAVTYDDNGVRIPLGERDNFNINDIRYGLLPFGIGLTGYGLFNNQEALGGKINKRKR